MSGPDHHDLENDPVWKLVDEAKAPEAGPFFVRNVMRAVRLAEETPVRWWQRLLRPKPLLAGALGAAAAVVVTASLNPAAEKPGRVETSDPVPVTAPALDELVEEEMLFEAADDPSAFSDEALVAMLY